MKIQAFEQKEALIELLSNPPQDIAELASNELSKLGENLRSSRFPIVFAGRFSCGKSTLINRLFLDEDMLPSHVNPSTARNMEIRYGEKKRLLIVRNNLDSDCFSEQILEDIENPDMETIRDRTSHGGDDLDSFDSFTQFILELPNEKVLQQGVSIIDTVGTQDIDDKYVEQTMNSVREAAAVVFITDARQQLTDSEVDFLKAHLGNTPKRLFMVVNKTDARDEYQLKDIHQDVLDRTRKLYSESGIRADEQFFLTSAKTGEGLDELRTRLIRFIARDRVRELAQQSLETALALIAPVRGGLEDRIKNLTLKKEGNQEELIEKKRKLEQLESDWMEQEEQFVDQEEEVLEDSSDSLEKKLKGVKESIRNDLYGRKIDRQELARLLATETEAALNSIIKETQRKIRNLFKKRVGDLLLTNDHDKIRLVLNRLGLVEVAEMTTPVLGLGGAALASYGAYGVLSAASAAAAQTAGQSIVSAIWAVLAGGTGPSVAVMAAIPGALPLVAGGAALAGGAYFVNRVLKKYKSRKAQSLVEDYFNNLMKNGKKEFRKQIEAYLGNLKLKLQKDIEKQRIKIERDIDRMDVSRLDEEIKDFQKQERLLKDYEQRLKNLQFV